MATKKFKLELTSAQVEAVLFAIRNFTQHGDVEDCGGDIKRFRALRAAERVIEAAQERTA